MTEPNLEHLCLTFKDFRINLKDFSDYINSVECPSKLRVPKYPVPQKDHLNFLKPGSKEVVSRQVHVHEHLPPMFPLLENVIEEAPSVETTNTEDNCTTAVSDVDVKKRPRVVIGQAVRELTSVMMTTSGFLSPAREGRLPESRAPDIALEPSVIPTETFKKPVKIKKMFNSVHDLNVQQINDPESLKRAMKIRKRKIKLRNMMAAKNYMIVTNSNKPAEEMPCTSSQDILVTKDLSPVPPVDSVQVKDEPYVEKLCTKPSKRKINILKKISVKNKQYKICKMEEEPNCNIGESLFKLIPNITFQNNFPNDFTIKPINPVESQEDHYKRESNVIVKSPMKNRKNNVTFKNEESTKTNLDSSLNFVNDRPFDFFSSNNVDMEPINLSLPTNTLNKRKANILRKISNKNKMNRFSKNQEIVHNYTKDIASGIMQDIGIPLNISKDLTIEPVAPVLPQEKPVKLESYYMNTPPFDTSIISKPTVSKQSATITKPELLKEQKSHLQKVFMPSKLDMDIDYTKAPNSFINNTPPTIPPMHFPFFNPFAGPGLIPPTLMNPLFPHLPITALNLPTFGQIPLSAPPARQTTPINLVSNDDSALIKQQPLSNITEVQAAPNKFAPELVNNLVDDTDVKLKKKKKKKNKTKHKSEKRKKSRSGSKRIKEEQLDTINTSVLPVDSCELTNGSSTISVDYTTSLSEMEFSESTLHKRDASPELAKFSALVTGQPKPKNPTSVTKQAEISLLSSVKRGRGRPRIHPISQHPKKEIWTCPVCGNQDNGNPMICCDGCNTWYHWVCVGIQVPPEATEDWFCRHCVNNKKEHSEEERSAKQKTKERKLH